MGRSKNIGAIRKDKQEDIPANNNLPPKASGKKCRKIKSLIAQQGLKPNDNPEPFYLVKL